MGTYLMMLYVSLEQEVALKDFFVDKGWPYRKPDLATITEHVGPLTVEAVPHDMSTPIPTSLLEKDIMKRKRTPAKNKSPIAKKAKNVRTSLRNPIMKLVTITAKTDEEFKQLTTGMPDSAEVVGEVTETFIEENVQDGEEEAVDIKIEPEDPDYDQAEDMTDMENDGDEINDTKNDFDVSKSDGILEKNDFAEYTGEGTSGMGEDDEAFLTSLKEEAKKPASCLKRWLRPLKEKSPQNKTKLTAAEKSQRWRDHTKENPEEYEKFKSVDALRKRVSRKKTQSAEQREKTRAGNRERQRKFREQRKSLGQENPKLPKRKMMTRKDKEKQNEYWKEKQRESRARRSAQKIRRKREKDRDFVSNKRKTTVGTQYEQYVTEGIMSQSAVKKAVQRARLPKKNRKFCTSSAIYDKSIAE